MIDHDTRAGRLAWLRANVQHGYAGRPGTSPGQPFQPGAITGGLDGPTRYVDTIPALRAALDDPAPAWVVWTGRGIHRLDDQLLIRRDNKTLVPTEYGALVLTGRGLRIDRAMNVAVSGVGALSQTGDAFEVSESRVIAIHCCFAMQWTDGGIDVVRGSTDVLIKDCSVEGGGVAKKGCLIGADDRPHARQFTGTLAHLGLLDDRQTRVTLDGCTFENVAARTPLVRHGRVVLVNHRVIGGGKGPLVESRTRARVMWLSGSVTGDVVVAATSHGPDARVPGLLYVSPQVKLNGKVIQGATWTPSGDELAWAATQ